jgi:hypothetical protein
MAISQRISIKSEEDLKKNSKTILKRINADDRGGLLFLLNPVYALEDAGFDMDSAMKTHIRRGLRYGAKSKARMRELEAAITEKAGRPVRAGSNADVSRLLFSELGIKPGDIHPPEIQSDAATIYESEVETNGNAAEDDYDAMSVNELKDRLSRRNLETKGTKRELVTRLEMDARTGRQWPTITTSLLESLLDAHPVVAPILEIRRLLETGWRFVNRDTYEKVKVGASVKLLRRVRFRPKK